MLSLTEIKKISNKNKKYEKWSNLFDKESEKVY